MEVLYVKLESTFDLPKNDMFSENDIFVKIIYGKQTRITETHNNVKDYNWEDEQMVFFCQEGEDKITVKIYDAGSLAHTLLATEVFDVPQTDISILEGDHVRLCFGYAKMFSREDVKKMIHILS